MLLPTMEVAMWWQRPPPAALSEQRSVGCFSSVTSLLRRKSTEQHHRVVKTTVQCQLLCPWVTLLTWLNNSLFSLYNATLWACASCNREESKLSLTGSSLIAIEVCQLAKNRFYSKVGIGYKVTTVHQFYCLNKKLLCSFHC